MTGASHARARRRPRPGEHLAPVDSAAVIAADAALAALDRDLVAGGWVRKQTVRPYLRVNGIVTLRFVWRRREDGACLSTEIVWRLPMERICP